MAIGSPVKVKQHFTNTQFIGGIQYVSTDSIVPFDPYRMVTEEGKLSCLAEVNTLTKYGRGEQANSGY